MKRRMLGILLCAMMVIGMMPTAAFAADRTGSGTENAPYVYAVSTAEELTEAVDAINADTSDISYYTISLQDSFSFTGMTLYYNTTTLLGNGNTLTLTGGIDQNITVVGKNETSKPVLILGSSDGTDTLTLKGQTTNDCPPFFVVGNVSDGKNCGTLKMYDGVTITGAVGNNYFGGAVIVGSGGYFEMNGGTIEKCGIDGGSTCFGGGVAVINKGKFTMNGGSIQDCFLNTGYCDTRRDTNNLFYNYGAGAGVFVSNGAVFTMNGGEIKNNRIEKKIDALFGSYGVGGGIAVMADFDDYVITARVEITGGTIEGNHATLGGGGIAVCGMIPDVNIIGSSTPSGGSGGIAPGLFIRSAAEDPVQIKNNTADGWADYAVGSGGILLYRLKNTDQVEISNAMISGNTAANGPGGGVESLTLSSGFPIDLSVKDTVLSGNGATEGGGVCLYNDSKSGVMKADFSNTVITGNTASDIGGGISAEGNSAENTVVTFTDGCTVYGNDADIGADDFYKNEKSTVEDLPTAEQMSKAANVTITGWYHDKEGSRYSKDNAEEYTPENSTTGELQLKAVKAVQYDVIFDWNDGSDKTETVSVVEGESLGDKMPANPTRSGYTFTGWNTQPNGTGTPVTENTVITGELIAYAQWSKNSNGDGAIIIPVITKKVPELNRTSHIAYVAGYPDGTVKPNGNITRAEVATILYRLLTEESRKTYSSAKSGFYDVDPGKWYNTYVATLNNAGVITDSSNGYFRPNDAITRAEFAAMLGQFVQNRRAANYFSDVSADYWAAIDIAVCANMGWITGYPNGTFCPDQSITRAEAMTIINRALNRGVDKDSELLNFKVWPDNAASDWFYYEVIEATNAHEYTGARPSEKWTSLVIR